MFNIFGKSALLAKIRHPQTNGNDERFHRTLKDELLKYNYFRDMRDAQKHFDPWRDEYNFERPHEALGMKPPISRYTISNRKYPKTLPEIEYSENDTVRKHVCYLCPRSIHRAFRGFSLG